MEIVEDLETWAVILGSLGSGIAAVAVWVNKISGEILVLKANLGLLQQLQRERLEHMSQRLEQIYLENKQIFAALDELKKTVYQNSHH